MPNKQPNVMDHFLEPLIAELEEQFTDGRLVGMPSVGPVTLV